jgi:hypothetical protein
MGTIPDSTCLVVLYERSSGRMNILLSFKNLIAKSDQKSLQPRVARAASHDNIDRGFDACMSVAHLGTYSYLVILVEVLGICRPRGTLI